MSEETVVTETPTVVAKGVEAVAAGEKPEVPTPAEVAEKSARTFTQDEFDKKLGARLVEERAKFADYDDLKAKAESADAYASELEELRSRLAAAEAESVKARVAAESGVPVELLHGSTEDELRATAEALAAFADSRKRVGPVVQSVGSDTGELSRDDIARAFLANPRG